ncbi:MAG: hypothetical protein C0502_12145 [Opitutus sp.]|nr:hypothetical protein [Opitutus sp.]
MKKTLLAALALTLATTGLHAEDPKSSSSITAGFGHRRYALSATLAWKLTAAATLKLGAACTGVNKIPGAPRHLVHSVGVTTGL